MIHLLKKYWLSLSVILIIFVLCFMNTEELPAAPMLNFDKVVHTIMILGLSGVIFFDGTNYFRLPISKKQIFLGVFILPILLAGLIEILQKYLTTTRSGDWGDFLFGAIGAFLGTGIALLINRRLLLKKQKS